MVPQFKVGKTFALKKHLQRYLHLPSSKDTNEARTRDISDSRPVFLPLNQKPLEFYFMWFGYDVFLCGILFFNPKILINKNFWFDAGLSKFNIYKEEY
jgi:hypothetical protein